MAGLEEVASEDLQSLRQLEIRISIKTRLLGALFNVAGKIPDLCRLFLFGRTNIGQRSFAVRLRLLLLLRVHFFGQPSPGSLQQPVRSPPSQLLASSSSHCGLLWKQYQPFCRL